MIPCVIMLGLSNIKAQVSSKRIHRSFDEGWSFNKDNVTTGPENVSFDASAWRKVDIPHDWSIEDLPNQTPGSIQGPFSKDAVSGHHTGYTVGGTAWYRKAFSLNADEQGQLVYIQFDGVYMNSDVWINGHHLGNHPNGYTPFYYNLTPYLQPAGKENVIAVQVKNEGINSRWYSGSGIYRHVWLTTVNPVHIEMWGAYVTTSKVTSSSAAVQLNTTILNEGKENIEVTISTRIIDANGKTAGTTLDKVKLATLGNTAIKQNITIVKPRLWSTETPQLYKAEIIVLKNGKQVDNLTTTFGVREIQIDAQHGLLVNGKRVIMKGGCIHHDYGPLGSAAIDRAEERKIELLKANGYNAIRTSHNPPSQTFLDICDRMGMLVIDEAFDMWFKSKTADDYHLYFNEWWNRDITNLVTRDRNHPSIILWSVGNEVPGRADSLGMVTRRNLVQRVHELDPTRKVTEAICVTQQWDKRSPLMYKDMDVAGYNYQLDKYDSDIKKYPERIFVGTETYPREALENWEKAKENINVLGGFVWTAFEYIGEVGCGVYTFTPIKNDYITTRWPTFTAKCGDINLIGDKNPASYYRDVVWDRSKIEMFSKISVPDNMFVFSNLWGWPDEQRSWTWPGKDGQKMTVVVYSRCQSVKLELNGKVIGEQKVPDKSITVTFDLPYQPGILVAKGYTDGKEIASTGLKTTGQPVSIRLKADRQKIKADRNDLAYVSVEIVDSEGSIVPNADNIEVNYTISGNGEIIGVGNGNTEDLSSFQQPRKKVFHGKGLVIIRPKGNSGKIMLKASANGLMENSLGILTK